MLSTKVDEVDDRYVMRFVDRCSDDVCQLKMSVKSRDLWSSNGPSRTFKSQLVRLEPSELVWFHHILNCASFTHDKTDGSKILSKEQNDFHIWNPMQIITIKEPAS